MVTETILACMSHIQVTSIQIYIFLQLVIYIDLVIGNNYVNEDAFPCLFVHSCDVWFGCLKKTVCLDIKIPQDLDLIILNHILWFVAVPLHIDIRSILPIQGPMQRRGHFITAVLVFFLCKHFTNDVDDIFHLHATQPALVHIHLVVIVLPDRISLEQLPLKSLFANQSQILCFNDFSVLLKLSMKLLLHF